MCRVLSAVIPLAVALVAVQFAGVPLLYVSESPALQRICHSPILIGNVCDAVCNSSASDDFYFHASKQLVRLVRANGRLAVLKIPDLTDRPDLDELLDSFDCSPTAYEQILDSALSIDLFNTSLSSWLGVAETTASAILWPWLELNDSSTSATAAVRCASMKQSIRLAHVDEFRLSMLYAGRRVFPRVLGTCGDAYMLAHVHTPFSGMLHELVPLLSRCSAASHVLAIGRYLRRLDSLPTGPLRLCDFKWQHFGWTDHFGQLDDISMPEKLRDLNKSNNSIYEAARPDNLKNINSKSVGQYEEHVDDEEEMFGGNAGGIDTGDRWRYVDLDAVMSASRLAATQTATACTQHEHCDFFDCAGRCRLDAGVCDAVSVGSNMAVLCRRLLFPDFELPPFGWRLPLGVLGVSLWTQHVRVLRRCSQYDTEVDQSEVLAMLEDVQRQQCSSR